MRVLVLAPFLPHPPHDGGRIRVLELARGLAERHDVELLALSDRDEATDAEALRALAGDGLRVTRVPQRGGRAAAAARALAGRRSLYGARYASRPFARELRERLRRGGVDVVQCEYAYTAAYRHAVGRAAAGAAAWVVDEHNLEYRLNETLGATRPGARGLAYRLYARRELPLRRAEELRACREADRVVTVSELDRDRLRADLPDVRVDVVPNGVDPSRFGAAGRDEAALAPEALFVGKLDYRPNVDGATWFAREVLPRVHADRPDARLRLVGAAPAPAVRRLGDLPGVEVVGPVADTRPHLARAALVVIPLRAGSGTRLKLLEAMAAGCAVVTTRLGCEGVDVVPGRHVEVADDAEGFAAHVVALLADPERRRRLARAGRELAEARYAWPRIVRDLEQVHAELVAERRAAGR